MYICGNRRNKPLVLEFRARKVLSDDPVAVYFKTLKICSKKLYKDNINHG